MLSEASEFVIQGIAVEGDIFQPGDWAERLCNSLARTGSDGGKTYSSYVRAVVTDGIQAVAARSGRGSRDAEARRTTSGYWQGVPRSEPQHLLIRG